MKLKGIFALAEREIKRNCRFLSATQFHAKRWLKGTANSFSSSKGQFLVVSLITTVMVLFAFMTIYPILKSRIDAAVIGMDAYAATLLQLSPFFILLSLILTIIFASLPVRE